MGNKKFLFISLLILAIGFAAVSTTLYITGNVAYQTKKSNFDVYFSGAEIDNVDVSNEVIKDKKHIEYTSNELKTLNDTSVLKYEVTNDSAEYDATVTISCTPMKTDYVEVTLTPVTFDIDAGEIKTGEIEAKLIKVSETEQNISIDCELDVKAKERTSTETILEKNNNYKISGNLLSSDNEALNKANLLIKSEPQITRTDRNGYFYVDGLERGRHHIYYKEDGDYELSDEELKEYLIAEVSTNGYLKIINKDYKITNIQYGKDLENVGLFCQHSEGTEWDFDYVENKTDGQPFGVDEYCDGTYKIELWGASGSYFEYVSPHLGGYGAYTSGIIELKDSDNLYFYVGGEGKNYSASLPYGTYSFNGASGGNYGCYVYHQQGFAYNFHGGGATDVRLENKNWNIVSSLKSRIMVAAGGASGNQYETGVNAGGLRGYSGSDGTLATQVSAGGPNAGGFGYGGIPTYNASSCAGNVKSGAGSGYYGGGASNVTAANAGMYSAGSGSSFISGHLGCVAIKNTTDNTITQRTASDNVTKCTEALAKTDIECSKHYSEYIFNNTKMIDGAGNVWTNDKGGQEQMPNPLGGKYATGVGHTGNGHARITLISLD